jgi:L-asparaginase / beta-aspartyl-peptidase
MSKPAQADFALALHGGAGVILREKMSDEMEARYRDKLGEALLAGETRLEDGTSAIDAVVATVRVMEDSELFNAGRGAVFTKDGKNEMDACLMEGAQMNAGGVAAVTNIRNPIEAARAVMEGSNHVLLIGTGAEGFAKHKGLEIVDPSYFHTDKRWKQLLKARAAGDETSMDHSDHKFGTVGAVALDRDGNVAAATSTGGMTNKAWGRVGDTPVIGAGTYASNETCAVSATGHGEYFMRFTVARDVAALMEFKGLDLKSAAEEVVHRRLGPRGGEGGLIAVDRFGNVALPFNTSGMHRASVTSSQEARILIFKD